MLPTVYAPLAIIRTILEAEDSFLRNETRRGDYQRYAKIAQIVSTGVGLFNTLAVLGGICYPPFQWTQSAVQLAAVGFLLADAQQTGGDKEQLPRMAANAFSIVRLLYEMRGMSSSFVGELPPLDKVWISIISLEITSRLALVARRSTPRTNES